VLRNSFFFNFIIVNDYVTNTFVSVNTLQSLGLGTDKLKSINNYNKIYFVGNIFIIIFVKIGFMKILSIVLILFLSSCQVTKFKTSEIKQEKKYQKELFRITKSYVKSYSKKNREGFVNNIKNLRIVYDTIPK
jgi:hypothetical protein